MPVKGHELLSCCVQLQKLSGEVHRSQQQPPAPSFPRQAEHNVVLRSRKLQKLASYCLSASSSAVHFSGDWKSTVLSPERGVLLHQDLKEQRTQTAAGRGALWPVWFLLQHVLCPEEARETEHKAMDCLGSSLSRAVALEAAVTAVPALVSVEDQVQALLLRRAGMNYGVKTGRCCHTTTSPPGVKVLFYSLRAH